MCRPSCSFLECFLELTSSARTGSWSRTAGTGWISRMSAGRCFRSSGGRARRRHRKCGRTAPARRRMMERDAACFRERPPRHDFPRTDLRQRGAARRVLVDARQPAVTGPARRGGVEPDQRATERAPFRTTVAGVEYTVRPVWPTISAGSSSASTTRIPGGTGCTRRGVTRSTSPISASCGAATRSAATTATSASRAASSSATGSRRRAMRGGLFDQYAISNNHLLTDDPAIAKVLKNTRVGDQIHFRGYLAEYRITGVRVLPWHQHHPPGHRQRRLRDRIRDGGQIIRPGNPGWRPGRVPAWTLVGASSFGSTSRLRQGGLAAGSASGSIRVPFGGWAAPSRC